MARPHWMGHSLFAVDILKKPVTSLTNTSPYGLLHKAGIFALLPTPSGE